MEKTKRCHLSFDERQTIYAMRAMGDGFTKIARAVRRDRQTIRREMKRNRSPVFQRGKESVLERTKSAHEKALRRRSDCKRGKRGPLKLVAIRLRVESLLEKCKYSPEEIAKLLRQGDDPVKVSGKTLRRWIVKEAKELQQHLPFRGRKRRHRLTSRGGKRRREAAPPKRSIHQRNVEAAERREAGHKEFDFIVCQQSVVSILVGVDRKTRRVWLRRVENREAETARTALIGIEMSFCPPLRKTLTFDNDPGFQRVFDLERLLGIQNFFCDPYCSWQKGSVENVNGRVRRFFPKGTDLTAVTQARLDEVEMIINARPMDCLDDFSPDQCWAREVKAARMMLH
jgi:IS30 family transposase